MEGTIICLMDILIVGTGYVGLTTGACLAHKGNRVICADIDVDKVFELRNGKIPIVEAGLSELVIEGLESGRLRFVVDTAEAAKNCEVVFLCVPTPLGLDGSPDLSYLQIATAQISENLHFGAIVVNKSTVPVGSTKVVESVLNRPDVKVVSNPEFLREGSAVSDFLQPDRVVIGSDDKAAAEKVASLYVGNNILMTDPKTAETIKYASNAFLASKLSFMNAIAAICEGVGANMQDVINGMGSDKRIGNSFLQPGPGWGGSCFPKDSRELIRIAENIGYSFDLLKQVILVNEQQLERVLHKVRTAVGGDLSEKKIAIWGLTFKAGTDDLRDSPAVAIVIKLLEAKAVVHAFDPTVTELRNGLPTDLVISSSAIKATANADALLILTEWEEFRIISPNDIASSMASKQVIDARNLLDRTDWKNSGFSYQGIGY